MCESNSVSLSSATEVSLRDLQIILSIASTGSFRTSAKLLHTSQPAISRAVKRVEAYFETEIFVRGPRGAQLTTTGEFVARTVRQSLDDLGWARNKITGNGSKIIRIGAAPAAVGTFLGGPIHYWTEEYPHHRIEIIEHGADMLQNMLLSEQCDLAIIASPFEPKITQNFLRTIPIRALFRPEHPAAIPDQPISLEELSDSRLLIYTSGFTSTTLLMKAFTELALQPKIAYQSANVFALLRMAESGLGVAVVGNIVDTSHTTLVSRPIVLNGGEGLKFDLSIAWLTQNTDPDILKFARLVEQYREKIKPVELL